MKKNTPAPLKKGIIKDPVAPQDLLSFAHYCECCSYFNSPKATCSLEHNTELHLKKNQLKSYSMGGKMALCRNLEID